MAKQSKAKARKKAQKKALLSNIESSASNTHIQAKNASEVPEKSPNEVIINDHLDITPHEEEILPIKSDKAMNSNQYGKVKTLKKISAILLITVLILIGLAIFIYNRTHKASYNTNNPISLSKYIDITSIIC